MGLVIDTLSIPKSLVEFQANIDDATQYLYALIYSPENWSGVFDTFPEGNVDMNDMAIVSPVNAALEIEVVDGNLIDGRVWWDKSCDFGSQYQGLLIEGRIQLGGSRADVRILDFIGGHKIIFLEGQLKNDGTILEFAKFPEYSGLNGSRIAKNSEPATLENWSDIYCDWFLSGNSDHPRHQIDSVIPE